MRPRAFIRYGLSVLFMMILILGMLPFLMVKVGIYVIAIIIGCAIGFPIGRLYRRVLRR